MTLTCAIAKKLLNTLSSVQDSGINIYNDSGKIIASSYPSCVGSSDSAIREYIHGAGLSDGELCHSCCLLRDGKTCIGAVQLLGPSDDAPAKLSLISTISELVLENCALSEKNLAKAQSLNGALSIPVGVHPLEARSLENMLAEVEFDPKIPRTTLYIQLEKLDTIEVDVGLRELVMDNKQVQYSVKKYLDFLSAYFSGSDNYIISDPASGNALVLYAGKDESDDMNTMRIFHICEYLLDVAKRDYCLNLFATIGIRCTKLSDYERQYEQLVKRHNAGRMMFPDKNIFWGHAIILGSLIFHLSRNNRIRLSSVLTELLNAPQSDVLLETLDIFFQCNMSQNDTAAKLMIHRNTLKYRMSRIEELTKTDLKDIDSLLSLRLALLCRSSLLIEDGKA